MSASTETSSSTHYYVPLPGNDKARAGVSSPRLARGQQAGGRRCVTVSSACMLLLLVGLLLFFLVPRRPIVRYQSSTLALDDSSSELTLTQTFSYYNPNYYTVCVRLKWCWRRWRRCVFLNACALTPPPSTSPHLIHPAFPPSLRGRNWNNLHIEVEDEASRTPLGFGWRNLSFPVGALHSASVAVNITITAAFGDLGPLIKAQCSDKGFVIFSSSGKGADRGCGQREDEMCAIIVAVPIRCMALLFEVQSVMPTSNTP